MRTRCFGTKESKKTWIRRQLLHEYSLNRIGIGQSRVDARLEAHETAHRKPSDNVSTRSQPRNPHDLRGMRSQCERGTLSLITKRRHCLRFRGCETSAQAATKESGGKQTRNYELGCAVWPLHTKRVCLIHEVGRSRCVGCYGRKDTKRVCRKEERATSISPNTKRKCRSLLLSLFRKPMKS